MTSPASDTANVQTAPEQPAPAAAPQPEQIEMEVVDAEPVDEPTPAENGGVSTAPANATKSPAVIEHDLLDGVPEWTHEGEWPHQWIEFEGDRLAYRIPKPSAVTGFSNSQGKYVSNRDRGEHVQLFLQLHLSAESFKRVIFRMMHPDSTYDLFTLARLVEQILSSGLEGLEKELESAKSSDDAAESG